MPSVSKAQQALMGQAYAIKIGDIKPSDLNPKYKKEILSLAKSMTKKQLEKFASTKHKGLPDHVNESSMGVSMDPVNSASIPKFYPKGPGKIVPFLDTDAKQKSKGNKNLQNLKDYRDWLNDD